MPLWRGGSNTRILTTVLLTPPASKAADMAHLCVPQNQALGVCRGFVPDIQVCSTHGREDLVNATITLNAEEEELPHHPFPRPTSPLPTPYTEDAEVSVLKQVSQAVKYLIYPYRFCTPTSLNLCSQNSNIPWIKELSDQSTPPPPQPAGHTSSHMQ